MKAKEFKKFRLVGGTALSLQIGHRLSVDIDLFSDAAYGTINFKAINKYLRDNFSYVDTLEYDEVGIGTSYFIGKNKNQCSKLDVFYTDGFVYPLLNIDDIRMASAEEIIAMKLEVIGRGGRKKDFWDIHELTEFYSFEDMFGFYKERYPHSYSKKEIVNQFTNFSSADHDFDPVCLKGKYWEVIKLDLVDFVKRISHAPQRLD